VRIAQIVIAKFRSLENVSLDPGGLVVLFGRLALRNRRNRRDGAL
jgi:hypothetical protein